MLFTLIKAETWIHDAPDRLRERFEESYAQTLRLFTKDGHWVAAYLPVETIGNIVVSHVERPAPDDERILFKRKPGASFSPRGVQVPLMLALRFAVSEFLKNRNVVKKAFHWAFGYYQDLFAEMEKLEPDAEAAGRIKFYGNIALLGRKPGDATGKERP